MPTFDSPSPIHALVEVGIGEIVVRASDTTRTTVEIRPTHEGRRLDTETADGTQVRFAQGRLEVKTPKQRLLGLLWRPGSIDVTIDLPTGSDVVASTAIGDIEVSGSLEVCRLKTHAGDVRVEDAEVLELHSSAGDVRVDRAGGTASITSTAGGVSVDEVAGAARIKASAGEIMLGRTFGDVLATAPYAQVRVREAVSGTLTLTTSYGDIEVGIPEGTAARLDVTTEHGRIRNELTPTDDPPGSARQVTVVARAGYGQVTIRRP